jgi:hypothetical protein
LLLLLLLLLLLVFQVSALQQEAALSELLSSQKSSSTAWTDERRQLEESAGKWRQKAVLLQQEVRQALKAADHYSVQLFAPACTWHGLADAMIVLLTI